jgi:uncharacterized SAM-binding protein YcdF (DUF218 family)
MRRATAAVGAAAVAIAAVWLGLTAHAVLVPSAEAARSADAVIVLAGGAGDRLEGGMALVGQGVAEVLVVSDGTRPAGWPLGAAAQNWVCAEEQVVEVVCPVPEPFDTRGEVAMVDVLADERGWESVVVVTSGYHAHRAGALFDRCGSTATTVVATPSELAGFDRLRAVVHEIGGAAVLLVDRRC